jgi:integrase/recombinase XerD
VDIKHLKSKRLSPYALTEIWDLEEFLLVTKYESILERRAAERMLWDLDARNKDIILIKRKNIRFKEAYAEGEIPHEAKTGPGPFVLTVSFADVLAWYNQHPFKYPEARLMCNSTGRPLEPDVIRDWMYELRDNIKTMLDQDMIKDDEEKRKLRELLETKKWNPYCIRHSAITYDSDYLPEYAVKKKVRWTMNSRQAARYIKPKMSPQLTNMILVHNGVLTEPQQRPKPKAIPCGKCKAVNAVETNCVQVAATH